MEVGKILVSKSSTIKDVMKIIDAGEVKTALVVDEGDHLLGIVTDGNIRRGILSGISISDDVAKVMNNSPIYASESDSKDKINMILRDKKILGMPVVDKDGVVVDFVMLGDESYRVRNNLSTIAVIGGAGYIGSVLVRKLLELGYRVNILDNLSYGYDSLSSISLNINFRLIKGDTRNITDVISAVKDADAVVHLAEIVGDPACALNPQMTQEVNYLATKLVAMVCKHFQINRFIYASSCSVYGQSENGKLLNEQSDINPVSLYAKMKVASEEALMGMADNNFQPTILRLSTVFGWSYRPRFDLVVNLMVAKALKEKSITVCGGSQWRPFVHVSDVADVIVSVLTSPIASVGNQIFNVGLESNNMTILDLGKAVKYIVGLRHNEVYMKVDDSVDKRDYCVDFSKIRNVMGNVVKTSVADGISDIVYYLGKNPDIDYKDKKYSNVKVLDQNGS